MLLFRLFSVIITVYQQHNFLLMWLKWASITITFIYLHIYIYLTTKFIYSYLTITFIYLYTDSVCLCQVM